MYGDIAEGKEVSFDDSSWYDIGIPHSFGIPYFMENDFYVGYGCYRKHFVIQPEWLGKSISLDFQGAFQDVDIYLNGQWAGNHKGGYTAFQIDISDLVHEGDNLLFVRLNNLWNPRLAPRAGEHARNAISKACCSGRSSVSGESVALIRKDIGKAVHIRFVKRIKRSLKPVA